MRAPPDALAAGPPEATSGSVQGRDSRIRAYYVLGPFTVIYAFANPDRNAINLALGAIKRDLHASDTIMGLIAGLGFSGVQLLFGLPIARWADRGDRRLVIGLAVGLWSVMTMACGAARTVLQLGLGRMAVGVGEATGPVFHSFLADIFDKSERGRAVAIYALGAPLSVLAGFPLLGIIQQSYGWRVAFFAAGAPGLALTLAAVLTLRDPRKTARAEPPPIPSLDEVFRTIWRQRSYLFLTLGFSVAGFGSTAFAVWGPTFLARIHHMSIAEIGAAFGLIQGLAGLAGGLCGGLASDLCSNRWGDRWKIIPFAMTATGLAPAILLTVATPSQSVCLAGMGLIAFLGAFQFAPVIAVIQTVMPARMRALGGSINGFAAALFALGLGPLYIGFVNDRLNGVYGPQVIRFSLASVALFCLLGAGLFWLASRFVKQDIAMAEAFDARPLARTT